MRYKKGDCCKRHKDEPVKEQITRKLIGHDEKGWPIWKDIHVKYYCWTCHHERTGRHEQGPEQSRIKGQRLIIRNQSVNKVRKILKGTCGVKKIRMCHNGVEVIHTGHPGLPTGMMTKLENAGFKYDWR